jgi:hypothetical protein
MRAKGELMIDFVRNRKRFIRGTKFWSNSRWSAIDSNPYVQRAPLLRSEQLEGGRVVPSRVALLHHLPAEAVVVEVGTQYGYFAEKILDVTRPTKLHLIDKQVNLLERNWSREMKACYQRLVDQGVVEIHKGDSATLLDAFSDAYFD